MAIDPGKDGDMKHGKTLLRTVLVTSWLVLLLACAPAVRQPPPPEASRTRAGMVVQGAHDSDGQAVARHLQDRYDDTAADCRKNASDPNPLPAVLCSGILLRTTVRGNYDVWNPNLGSPLKYGVSFSWLRRDSAFGGLVFNYDNGFIILPHFFADSPSDGYTQLAVLCIFPFDADTLNRKGDKNDGCGQHGTTQGTGPCQAQKIETAAQWLAKFGAAPNRYRDQCGFTLTAGTPGASLSFQAQASIRTQLTQFFGIHNEVMVEKWAQNDAHIPLEAFFYDDRGAGLASARLNQWDFQAATRRWVPIIKVTMPTAVNGPAAFTYVVADQQIP